MHVHQQRFSVSFEYPVYFCRDAFDPGSSVLAEAIGHREPERRHRVVFLVEARVASLWPHLGQAVATYCASHAERLELVAPLEVQPGGEACKNDPALPGLLISQFDRWGLDRQSSVVIVGGGAFQDMVGYAAATFHRGVRVVRMPTTVLGQNDGGVGVKNGVNALGKKNLLGTFCPPFAVVDDFGFLRTLEPRDVRAGLAEAVKVALLKNAGFYQWLDERAEALARLEPVAVEESIRRCAVAHLDHIAGGGDPFELGSSRPLDFGHWSAHKLEVLSDYALRHGEAVAIGLALDVRYSVETGLVSEPAAEAVVGLLERLGLPTWHDALAERDASGQRRVMAGLEEFREHLGGELTLMMLADIGRGVEVHAVDGAAVERAIRWLQRRCHGEGVARPAAAADAFSSTGK